MILISLFTISLISLSITNSAAFPQEHARLRSRYYTALGEKDTNNLRQLTIHFDRGTRQIEILASHTSPEFGMITVAFALIIALIISPFRMCCSMIFKTDGLERYVPRISKVVSKNNAMVEIIKTGSNQLLLSQHIFG